MLSLSPAKILVVLVVGLIVLGPDKLPRVAKQLGAIWGDVRRWRQRVEEEVRGVFPDLPSTGDVAHAVRSPLSFLDRLADSHERDKATSATPGPVSDLTNEEDRGNQATSRGGIPGNVAAEGISGVELGGSVPRVTRSPDTADVPDDPSMN